MRSYSSRLKAMPPPVPQGEARPDDRREPDLPDHFPGFQQVVGEAAPRHFQPDAPHGLLEKLPVLGLADGFLVGPDHLHPELFQDARLGHLDGRVQAGLPSQGGQKRLGALPFDDLGHHLGGDRLHVGPVRGLRVGHDGGRVGVDQDDFEPLLLQGLAGLGSRVVELAGLADDDGSRADDQDFMDVGSPGHDSLKTI